MPSQNSANVSNPIRTALAELPHKQSQQLKPGFHMIADRRSQIPIRFAMIADDRRSSFHMIADDRRPYCDLRSAIIWKPAFSRNLKLMILPTSE